MSSVWHLKQIYTRECGALFWIHVSANLASIYSNLFNQWKTIPLEMQNNILAMHGYRVYAITSKDRNV